MKFQIPLRMVALAGMAVAGAVCFASYSSNPGAGYTHYLDFGPFNFTGNWGNSPGYTPGNTPAYSHPELIGANWARVAEKYSVFSVNITTVDPAAAAGHAGSDLARQNYYDDTAKLMHSVVAGNGSWLPGAGGVSYVGVTPYVVTGSNGYHTNWIFAEEAPTFTQFIGEATAHEEGHGLGLWHQSDKNVPGHPNAEYSTNFGATGNGSFAPIMGDSYYAQRGLWRNGPSLDLNSAQNDVSTILSDPGMSLTEDGVGHTFGSATELALSAGAVDAANAHGVIVPGSAVNPTPLGTYSKDVFKFRTLGGAVSLTLNDGGEWLTPGVAADGAMLRGKLSIFKSSDLVNPVATGVESASTLLATFSGSLAAGDYFAVVESKGGFTSAIDAQSTYYNMGSFFLSGNGFVPVPEPASFALLGIGALALIRRRRQ